MANVYRSKYPDVKISDIDIVEFVLSNRRQLPDDHNSFTDALTGETRTLADIRQRVKSLAHGLRELGVQRNEIVAFFSPNTIDYAIICLAIIGCGATLSPISAGLTAVEFQDQLKTCQARFLIAHSALRQTAIEAVKGTSVKTIIQADGEGEVGGVVTAQSLAITCTPTDLVTIAPSEADERIALICFSSGTSGPAKGVMTSHRNLVSNIEQWYGQVVPDFDFSPHIICFIPMSHIYGLHIFVFAGLWSGRRVVIMSKFQLDVYLRSIQKYRSVDLFTVPPVVLLLVKSPLVEKYDLSSVQRIMSAAAPLTPELSSALESKFKQLYGTIVYCYQGYGMTEASPLVCMVPFPELGMTFSIGRPIPNIPLRFVNPDTMEDVKTNPDGSTEHGEIWVTGPNVMKGYYNNAAANQAAFQLDADGTRWYRTGDVGCMDRDGYVTINDRIKEMIKYKGFQVIPSELEGKLVEHPHIEDAAVVGYYAQDQATELPVAFVVLAREATNDAAKAVEGIHQWLNKRVANHKRLRGGIWILNSIPKNSSGKILRRRLRDLLQDERSGKL